MPVHCLAVVGWALCTIGPQATAQISADLNVQTYAGLSITGAVGVVYSVEYVTDLAETENPGAWHSLEFLQLPVSPYLWVDKSASATAMRFYRALEFSSSSNLVYIPSGTFRMGSPTNEVGRLDWEGPQTEVTISRGFWMGKHEVTQGEYLAVLGKNPSQFTGDDNLPVERASWIDATNYCGMLTQLELEAGRIPRGARYRLPTEAEWEHACRAETSTRFSYGDDPGYLNINNYAWTWHNSGLTTQPVEQRLPNPWGLYDVHGNVWEWCQDSWSNQLPGGTAIDPLEVAPGLDRVLRGGGWSYEASNCRSASRTRGSIDQGYSGYGFRVMLTAGEPR